MQGAPATKDSEDSGEAPQTLGDFGYVPPAPCLGQGLAPWPQKCCCPTAPQPILGGSVVPPIPCRAAGRAPHPAAWCHRGASASQRPWRKSARCGPWLGGHTGGGEGGCRGPGTHLQAGTGRAGRKAWSKGHSQSLEERWRKVNLRWVLWTSSMGTAIWVGTCAKVRAGVGDEPSPGQCPCVPRQGLCPAIPCCKPTPQPSQSTSEAELGALGWAQGCSAQPQDHPPQRWSCWVSIQGTCCD